jgi:hypothetical protein
MLCSLSSALTSHVVLSKWLIYCKDKQRACGAGFNWVMTMFSDKHVLTMQWTLGAPHLWEYLNQHGDYHLPKRDSASLCLSVKCLKVMTNCKVFKEQCLSTERNIKNSPYHPPTGKAKNWQTWWKCPFPMPRYFWACVRLSMHKALKKLVGVNQMWQKYTHMYAV